MGGDLIEKINDFEKNSWAIKRYASERWGKRTPCPIRFIVNPYYSCSLRCAYCYVWFDKKEVQNKEGFRKSLIHDIKRAEEYGLNNLAVEVSSSTDPFQEIENKYRDSLFAIEKLLDSGFKVVIVTKNPRMLLYKDYIHLLKNENVFIDVTITTLENRLLSGTMIDNEELTTDQKISAVKEIIDQGKDVRIKLDPIILKIPGVKGQDDESIEDLIKKLSKIGVKLLISKTLRLNAGLPDASLKALIDFYKKNGELIGENYILKPKLRRELLEPVFNKCQKYNLNFCPCCDNDVFSSESVYNCHVNDEKPFCDGVNMHE